MKLSIKGKTYVKMQVEKNVEVSLEKDVSLNQVTVYVGEVGALYKTPLLDINNGSIYLRCGEGSNLRKLGFRTGDTNEVLQAD